MTTNSGFWIPFEEIAKAISHIRLIHFGEECCALEPTLTHKKKWNVKCYHGRWMKGVSAGGCKNNTGNILSIFYFLSETLCDFFVRVANKKR